MRTLSPRHGPPCPRQCFTAPYGLALIYLTYCFCSAGHVSGQSTKAINQEASSIPAARLQRQRDEKSEEIRAEREELKPLVEYRSQLQTRKATSLKVTIKPAVTDAIIKGKKLLEEMATMRGKVNLRDDRILQLSKVYQVLPSDFASAIEGASLSLPRSTTPIISRVIDELGSPPIKNKELVQGALEKLLMKLGADAEFDETPTTPSPKPGSNELTWESAKKEIEEAHRELTTIESELPKTLETYKASVTDYVTNLENRLDAELAARRAKIKSLEDERDQLEQDLDKAGKKEDNLNTMLIYAVYGMVLAIVTLFLLLRFFPKDLARSIVVERTMIELLSMGFLLLTVIILGTGKLITGETLGALLGTIAGYIFGQKQGERRGATEEREKMASLLRSNVSDVSDTPPHS